MASSECRAPEHNRTSCPSGTERKSVHQCFTRWAKKGSWEQAFLSLVDDPKNEYVMLDASLVRTHQHAATSKGAAKEGPRTRLWGVPEVA